MKHYIKKINNRYYLFFIDKYNNLYDSMYHFDTWEKALNKGLSYE